MPFKYTNTAVLLKAKLTTYGLKSFRFESAKIWNSLPKPLRNITSFNQFITNISSWYGNCNCCTQTGLIPVSQNYHGIFCFKYPCGMFVAMFLVM